MDLVWTSTTPCSLHRVECAPSVAGPHSRYHSTSITTTKQDLYVGSSVRIVTSVLWADTGLPLYYGVPLNISNARRRLVWRSPSLLDAERTNTKSEDSNGTLL